MMLMLVKLLSRKIKKDRAKWILTSLLLLNNKRNRDNNKLNWLLKELLITNKKKKESQKLLNRKLLVNSKKRRPDLTLLKLPYWLKYRS